VPKLKNFSHPIRLLAATAFFTSIAHAHIPNASLLVRQQPGLLSREHAFSSEGGGAIGSSPFKYTLNWFGPGHSMATFTGLPGGLYQSGAGASTWVIYRKSSVCFLKADSAFYSCPSAGPWAQLEITGQPEMAAQSLYQSEILSAEEVNVREIDGRKLDDPRSSRTQLVMGYNGTRPAALIEVRGPRASTEVPGQENPLVQFDQTFLAPLLMRIKRDGETYTIQASSDLEVRRNRSRATPVLASKLVITSDTQLRMAIDRQEAKPAPGAQPLKTSSASGDVSSYKNSLSSEGAFMLESLLLTH
jgi:hypothetical protein